MSKAVDTPSQPRAAASRGDASAVAVSVLVPVTERPQDLVELYREFAAPLERAGLAHEFIFVAEPWFPQQIDHLAKLAAGGEPVRVYQASQTQGEAALLRIGAERARADVLVTLPAYRRVTADVLPVLVEHVARGADLAVARRWPRRDSWINRLQSRVFHALLGALARGGIHDVACGVRAMRRDVFESLPVYGDFFRFLPILALREGFRVEEVPAPQHERDAQPRLYGPGTYVRRFIDVLGLAFLVRFTDKPLRFFGLVGTGLGAVGGAILLLLLLQRLAGQAIANRPLLLLAVLLVVLGAQAFALGLVGEIIVHLGRPERRVYRLATRDRPPDA